MKKFLNFLMMGLLTSAVVVTGCNKDDDDPKNSELIRGSWQLTALTVNPVIPIIGSDIYAQFDACEKDDITIFEANGVVRFDEGASKCAPNDPQTTTGTYTWNTDETIITVNDSSGATSYTVSSISNSQMVVTNTENIGGVNYTYTATYTKR